MGKTILREACSDCGSKDNLITYLNDKNQQVTICKTPGCIVKGNLEEKIKHDLAKEIEFITGEYKEIRGISKETCEKIGIMQQNNMAIFQYINAQKTRIEKDGKKYMPWINYNEKRGLFGQHLAQDFDKPLIVTEGEFDAASCVEAGIQAVSISTGAGGQTKSEIQGQLEFLNKFQTIILWFDNDAAGNLAIDSIKDLFPANKLKIIRSEYKDANEALQKSIETIKNIVESASFDRPKGLKFGDEVDYSKSRSAEEPGVMTCFKKLNEKTRGLFKSRLYVLAAGTGIGKSTFLRELAYHFIANTELKVANLFLEERQKDTIDSYIAIDNNINVNILKENPSILSDEEFDKSKQRFSTKRLAFQDESEYNINSEDLFKMLDYLVYVEKFDVILLDHISIIVSGAKLGEAGERRYIDELMHRLRSLVQKSGCIIIAACHVTNHNPGTSLFEDGKQMKLSYLSGSTSIAKLADVVFGLEREMTSDLNQNKVKLRILKNRITGNLGIADILYYMEDTGRLSTIDKVMKYE